MQWYYANHGQRQGPVTDEEFQRLVASAVVRPETLVWKEGMADWLPYSQVAAPPPIANTGEAGTGAPPVVEPTEVCAVSGKRYPRREMIQYEGRWISAEHRDTFFQRIREGATQPGEMVYARNWPRFAAWFIDFIVLLAVSSALNIAFGFGMFGTGRSAQIEAGDFAGILALQGLLMLINIAVGLSYKWFFLARYQATPGKLALGLKVVRSDGSRLSTGRIIGRYFAEMLSGMILYIGYIMALFDVPQRRALHDYICDTRVIRAK
jgi:uncharacterized RDD family membrane protein YckC